MKEEIWKEIAEYPAYQVSNQGRIRRIRSGSGAVEGKTLVPLQGNAIRLSKQHPSGHGQLMWQTTVPEVVLLVFQGVPDDGKFKVVFRDGDRSNAALANLEWRESCRSRNRRSSESRRISDENQSLLAKIGEYTAVLKHLPKAAWPALTISQILKAGDDFMPKETLRKRLGELVELKRVTPHVDGIQEEGVQSRRGRPEIGYKRAGFPLGVLTDFSELLNGNGQKRVKIRIKRDAET